MKIVSVVGTRPNFMKTAPVQAALAARPDDFETVLVHTGQHYDAAMSDIFFEELGIGPPDHMLDVGSGTHPQQTARVMERLEPVLEAERPDLVLVPGDVNSTLAAALVAVKLDIPVGHIEAGLRSFDRTMPEEINRVLTDQIAELLFTHSPEAARHLEAEGSDPATIHYVGNTMIDTLVALRARIEAEGAVAKHGLEEGGFVLVTLHRPALVDGPLLEEVVAQLGALAQKIPVFFPAHPRTAARMERLGGAGAPGLIVCEPLGYLDFLALMDAARLVVTDSGGIQEETTALGVPCLTLRDNTERPVTVEMGTNMLLGLRPERVAELPALVEEIRGRQAKVPPLWDGAAAGRIVEVLLERR